MGKLLLPKGVPRDGQRIYPPSHRGDEGILARPPPLGIITFVDAGKVDHKRQPGYCYKKAGFKHVGFTAGGLWAWQMLPDQMPAPEAARGTIGDLFSNQNFDRGCTQ